MHNGSQLRGWMVVIKRWIPLSGGNRSCSCGDSSCCCWGRWWGWQGQQSYPGNICTFPPYVISLVVSFMQKQTSNFKQLLVFQQLAIWVFDIVVFVALLFFHHHCDHPHVGQKDISGTGRGSQANKVRTQLHLYSFICTLKTQPCLLRVSASPPILT